MTERRYNPSSPACGQWETLLADALDGLLKPEDEAAYSAHRLVCPACDELYQEARRGREWLEFLSPEPEVPAGLLDKILAQTGPGQLAGYGLAAGGGKILPMPPLSIPPWQRPGLVGQMRRFAEPRLLMTAAMAFFSIALTLNLTGVRLSSLSLSDLRPSAVLSFSIEARSFPGEARSFMERRLMMASTPIIRYYDHNRLVYEVQSGMRELRRRTEGNRQGEGEENRRKPQDVAPGESKEAPRRIDGGSPVEHPQQSVNPAIGPAAEPTLNDSEYLETSLTFQQRPAHSGGFQEEIWERSTVWTA